MEPIHESIAFSSTSQEAKKAEPPEDLLEKSWFFDNLLNSKRKTNTPGCYSDPPPSSSNPSDHQDEILPGKSLEETFSAIKKLPFEAEEFPRPAGLMRAPSLLEESVPQRVRKSGLERSSNNNLLRAPSLPACKVREEIQDEESEFSMSRLIRQASLKQSDLLPPRGSPKGGTQNSSTPKQRPRSNPGQESITDAKSCGGVGRQQQIRRTRLARSSSDMGFRQLQGFRDLSINEEKIKEPSSAKAWEEQSSSPQVKDEWADKSSVEEDMKAQIKFWARAVASNVRQEC